MNRDVVISYLPLYAEAALVTLRIAVFGIIAAILLGLVCALIQHRRVPLLRHLVGGYIELSRNTPLVIQLFFIYYGLPKAGIVFSGEVSAIIGLTFLGGSYMSEAFRSGIEAVERVHVESAFSLGMSPYQISRYVVLPQAVARAFPAFTANVVFLIKETSVVSIVAVPDLMNIAKNLIGLHYNTAEALTMLVVAYLLILLPVSLGAARLERRLRHGAFGD